MPRLSPFRLHAALAIVLAALGGAGGTQAQQVTAPVPNEATAKAEAKPKRLSDRQVRAADDAYLAGAQQLAHNEPAAAEKSFARAVELNPARPEYGLALVMAREHHVTALVQKAAVQRSLGHADASDKLLAEARALAPDNEIVAQHFPAEPIPPAQTSVSSEALEAIARLGGPIHFEPSAGLHSFHRRGDVQEILREVYDAYGIKATFDPSIVRQQMRFDLDDTDFDNATRVIQKMTHTFSVPLTGHSALLAKDTQDNRDRLIPLVEETVDVPGIPVEQLTELSNVAKNIFDIKQVAIQKEGSRLVMRGNEDAMRLVNTTFAGLLDGGGEVILQVHIYEYDRTHERNIGISLPSQAGVFSLAAEAQSIVSANQSLINQAVASGLLKLTGNYVDDLIASAGFLLLSGAVTSSKFLTLLGTFGNGLTYSGLFLGSGAQFNFLLNSSEARLLDEVQVRIGDNQNGVFRSGSRYPITTSTYSSAVPSSLSTALAGVSVNGTSAASLLSQYLNRSGTTSTVPQVQYEDLGLTLKATPQIQKSGNVHVKLDLKIEALGGAALNGIPVLNNRQLVSDVTIPEGQTVMLASEISKTEARALSGVPGLNDVPGFSGTNRDSDTNTSELLITITPRIVRRRSPVFASRRLLANVSPAEQ